MVSSPCSARSSSGFVQYIVLSSERKSSIPFVDVAPGRSPSGEHVAPRPSTRNNGGVLNFSRSSTQATLLICSARGDFRAHEFLHLLVRSRPLDCSCYVTRRCFLCPLVHPKVLVAPEQSRIPTLSVFRWSGALTFGYGCTVYVGLA